MKLFFSRFGVRKILPLFLSVVLLLSGGALLLHHRKTSYALSEKIRQEFEDKIRQNAAGWLFPGTLPSQTQYVIPAKSAYRLLRDGDPFCFYYVGDGDTYGVGASAPDSCWRYATFRSLRENYYPADKQKDLLGRLCNPFSDGSFIVPNYYTAAEDLRLSSLYFPFFRFMLFAPGPGMEEANRHLTREEYQCSAERKTELFLRQAKTFLQTGDILLIITHRDSDEQAAALRALAGHYNLLLCDMREVFASYKGSETLKTADGTLTDSGHRLYTDTILATVKAAVEAGRDAVSLEGDYLYAE